MGRKFLTIISFLVVGVIAHAAFANGDPSHRFMSFKEAEELSLKNSHIVQSQKHLVSSAKDQAFAQEVKRYPQVGFGASSMFMSKIGQINVPAMGVSQQVGDHTNWSVGPVVDWVVWDTGQIINKARSLDKTAEAQSNVLEYNVRQVLLGGRAAYIGAQLAAEQVRLVVEALRLARAQYAYVLDRKNAGTADLFDLTVAHQEMVDREKDFEEAQGSLAISKRDLVAAIGMDESEIDPDSISVEPIGNVLGTLLPRAGTPVEISTHPQVKELANKQSSAELASKSIIAKYVPQVNLHGTSGYEYPNLGANNTIQQNKLTLNLSVPILDWGTIHRESRSQKFQAKAALEQKKQTMVDLSRDVSSVREQIDTKKKLKVADARAVKDAVEVAKLSYESYQTGRIIFLDVQKANVKALSVKVDAARNDAELALQVARLLALAETEGEGEMQ